jgi:hypothetical protein
LGKNDLESKVDAIFRFAGKDPVPKLAGLIHYRSAGRRDIGRATERRK